MSAQFQPASLIVSVMSHLLSLSAPLFRSPFHSLLSSYLPLHFIPFRILPTRGGETLIRPFSEASPLQMMINSQTLDSRADCLDLLFLRLYLVATLLMHAVPAHVAFSCEAAKSQKGEFSSPLEVLQRCLLCLQKSSDYHGLKK